MTNVDPSESWFRTGKKGVPSLGLTLVLTVVWFGVTVSVHAQPPEATEATYLREVQQANAHLAAGQNTGAETALRNALARLPDAPAAHCAFGALKRTQGHLDEALESYATCVRLAIAAGDPLMEGRGLMGRLMIELQRSHQAVVDSGGTEPINLDAARATTMLLFRFSEQHSDLLDRAMIRARPQSIDLIVERDAAAATVRARRVARAAVVAAE